MHVSTKKSVVLLCIIAISVAGFAFATASLTDRIFTDATMLETGENAADRVTIYGNGVTFVSYDETVELEEDTAMIQFYLPAGALTDTLKAKGINVVKITTSEEYHPIIERGDIITVYTEEEVHSGKFLGWDNMLLLDVDNGTIMIPGNRITKIVLTEVVQSQGPKILVQIATDSPPGEYQLRISYLMRGPTWKPTYFVDLETSHLQCWAIIQNVEDWNNFTLVLVSGGPHIVYKGPVLKPYIDMYTEGMVQSSPSIEFTSTTIDEYHEYTYDAKLSFEEGTFVKLPLFSGTVSLRQEYFWGGGEVLNRYHVNNTLSEPLAAGTVEFYRDQTWVGEDSIPYTPMKGESIAIVNYAFDIKVTLEVTKSIDQHNHDVRGIKITIRNHKTMNIQILIEQEINGYTLVTSTPKGTRVGSTLSWVMNVDADGSATIYYEWEHYW